MMNRVIGLCAGQRLATISHVAKLTLEGSTSVGSAPAMTLDYATG